ncbi:hypothetical protein JS565_16715 [Salmonella enterica subsp. enterica serovar Senftenberg]|nr:hypothetical protein [Salmonella enterica subsp. enterica serovar Senftenberg]
MLYPACTIPRHSFSRPDTRRITRYSFIIYHDTAADSGEIGWSMMAKRVNNKPVPVGACRAYL